jgi:hypothetical protein
MQDKVMSGLAGPTTFVAAFPLPNGNISRQSIEVDFASTQVASLVIHLDRYDRLTVSSSEDLPVGAQAPAGAP